MRSNPAGQSRPRFFAAPAALRRWFDAHHDTAEAVWVGFYRRHTRTPSVTWPEAVDEALAVGWIDGIRKSIDEDRYMIRFTPRRKGSIWSAVNIRKAESLIAAGRMRAPGAAAFATRTENRSGIYSYEQRPRDLPEPYRSRLAKQTAAAAFFEAQPPSYRRVVTWWIVSAKREETREARIAKLITASAAKKRL